jgi:hypothetical protein
MSFGAIEIIGAKARLFTTHRDSQARPSEAPKLERAAAEVYRAVNTAPDQAAKVSAFTYYHPIYDEQGKPVRNQAGQRQFKEERVEFEPRLRPEFSAREVVYVAPAVKKTFPRPDEGLIPKTKKRIFTLLQAHSSNPIWTK